MAQQTDDYKMKSTQSVTNIHTLTAVEWLFKKMTEQGTNPYWDMRLIQAKQMEKEQIIKAFNEGTFSEMEKINAKQYYNETYER